MVIEQNENESQSNAQARGGGGHNLNNQQANTAGGSGIPNLNLQPENAVGGSSQFIRPPKPLVLQGAKSANSWKLWIQQYRWFEVATGTLNKPQEVQVATFMSAVGTEAVEIFNTFGCTDEQLANIDTIKQLFQTYFTPKLNPTYERYQLNRMVQEDGESFDEFLTKIKGQSSKCELGTLHDTLLTDKIIIGIRSETTREKLLAEENPTLDRITQMCRAIELTSKQLRDINNDSSAVHSIANKRSHRQRPSTSGTTAQPSDTFDCKRCGSNHGPKACPAYGKKCKKCGRDGHLAEMCRSTTTNRKTKPSKSTTKVNTVENEDDETSEDDFYINAIEKDNSPRTATNYDDDRNWFEKIKIGSVQTKVKLDSGAQCNVIAKSLAEMVGSTMMHSRTKRIITYGGEQIKVSGEIVAKTKVRGKMFELKFIVVDKEVSPVLGKTSCEKTGLILRVKEINQQVFDGLGCLKDYEYDIDFIDNPKFEIHAARRIPHAYQQKVREELDKMLKQNVIREITEATPAVSPMVVVKQKGNIRICIDPTDVNKNVIRRNFPLKTIEEIAAKIAGSTVFSKLDCRKGFWQIRLSERTQKYLTFATPWGRFCCIKLPFGLCSAPEVFQQIMCKLLSGIEKAEASMDDILIYGTNAAELQETTAKVIKRIEMAGLTLNKEKCEFEVPRIKFLGHLLSANGVEIDAEKVEAIGKLRVPENKTELQRLLGMVTYCAKFIPNLSSITQPLRKLLEKEVEFIWTPQQTQAFEKIKHALSTTPVLRYYDVKDDVMLQADASSYALGAALLQASQPIAYASRSLTKAELNYPQIEKEALAIRFACMKFHEYVYGKRLTVETDHKPLESIFKKSISSAPPRLQRILLDIAPYAPTVTYIKGESMYLADTLSRDCNNDEPSVDEEFEVLAFLAISDQAADRMRKATERDENLQQLRQIVLDGWPDNQNQLTATVKPYWNFRDQITEYEGMLLKSNKIIVPAEEKRNILNQLHAGHQGVQRTLAAARNNVFWLQMTKEITDHIEKCSVCEATQRANIKEPLISKEVPSYPFQIVATDLFAFKSVQFLLIADSYSGFFDFCQLKHSTSKEIIERLKSWFATHGVPEKLESDNGPQYASKEFRLFASTWGFTLSTSSPKFPQSNGLAERFVQTAKNMLRKCSQDNSDIKLALLMYRNTPRSEALGSPNQRLMSRNTRSFLTMFEDQLKPQIVNDVQINLQHLRDKQKHYYDRSAHPASQLSVGDQVRLQQSNRNWTNATVMASAGKPRSFLVRTDAGKDFRRNTSQIHRTRAKIERSPCPTPTNKEFFLPKENDDMPDEAPNTKNDVAQETPISKPTPSPPRRNEECTVQLPVPAENTPVFTRSGREVKRVIKMNL